MRKIRSRWLDGVDASIDGWAVINRQQEHRSEQISKKDKVYQSQNQSRSVGNETECGTADA